MKHTRMFIVALILLLAGQAFAQVDRSKKPAPGPAPKASFPEFYETMLDNGLKVFVVTNKAQPLVSFRLLIRSGAEFDGEHSGVANFTTSLLTSGTKKRTALQFASEADFLGLSVGAGSADDQMSLSGSGLKKHMDKLLDLMTDALYNPTFPQEELDKEKKQALSGLKTVKKNPDEVMQRLAITVGYNVHPYARFGIEKDVEAITREHLVAFHKQYFIPNNASIAVVGDVTPNEILPILKKHFDAWSKGTPPRANFPAPERIAGRGVHLVDLGSTQTQTAINAMVTGVRRSDPDYLPLSIMNSIIGGGFSGRLFQNLRETYSFTYGAYSSFESRKTAGVWSAEASVRRSATDSAFTQILHEMNRIRDEVVSSEELEMHKQNASGRFLLGLENPSSIASMVQNIDLYGLPKDYYKKYVSNIMAVTSADVQRLARKYLTPDNIAFLAVGDASQIAKPLESFGAVKMYDADMNPVTAAKQLAVDIDGETLMQKALAAMGGKDKLLALKSRVTEGELDLSFGPMQAAGTMTLTEKAPNKAHQKMHIAVDMGGQMQTVESERWVNGVKAVEKAPMGPLRELTGDELTEALEGAMFNDFARWKDLGYSVVVKEKKEMDGRAVYVAEMKKKHGSDEIIIDATSFLLTGKIEVRNTPQGPVSSVTKLGDYREVDGIMLPHSMISEAETQTMKMTVRSYKHNSDIPDSVFEKTVQ
ncbi:MAG: insulinase family protein [Bacteroidia bacterium]|nr:insulinase family protein [Bacteroidia bacterium]